MLKKLTLLVLVPLIFSASCKRQPSTSVQPNTVNNFKFAGGSFKDGKITVDPSIKVQPGSGKNNVILMRPNGNGITVSCFCVLEGGDCWAVSTDRPDGVKVACASQNCAGGEEPFCFMDIGDNFGGFNIRLAVLSPK